MSFRPQLSLLAYYALFFAFGGALYRVPALVDRAVEHAWRWLAVTAAVMLPAGALFSLHNSATVAGRPVVHAAALLFYALATWTALMALIGLANRFMLRPRPRIRYLADASYWVYLVHLQVMAVVLALVLRLHVPTAPTFLLVVAGTGAVCLALYPICARYTAVGRVLNGVRERRPKPRAKALAGAG